LDWLSGDLDEDGQASQEMDAAVQGRMAAKDWEMVRGVGKEGYGDAPGRMVLKKRKLATKLIGPGTPEVRGESRVKL
jgi:hypothetical protein